MPSQPLPGLEARERGGVGPISLQALHITFGQFPHRQQSAGFFVETILQVMTTQNIENTVAVFVGDGVIASIEGIGDDLTHLIYAIDPCSRIINPLPLSARQTSPFQLATFTLKASTIVQPACNQSGRNCTAQLDQQLLNFMDGSGFLS